jgi:hypothetical protein
VRAFLVTAVVTLLLVLTTGTGAAAPSSVGVSHASASSQAPTGVLGVCTPAWGTPVIPPICF